MRKAVMKATRLIFPLLFSVILLIFSILACRRSVPVTNTIPVFPQATEIPPGTDGFVDLLLERMQTTTPTTTFTVTGKVYSVPTYTTWLEVESFYDKALDKEWSALSIEYPELQEFSLEGIYMADWYNDSTPALPSRLHVMLAISPNVDEAFLVTALYVKTLSVPEQ